MNRIRRLLGSPWVPVGMCGIVGSLLSLPLLSYSFTYDQGVYADVADAMLRGGMVYRDAWEHKPPGIYYVYYLAFALFGRDFWAARLMEVLAVGLGSAGVVRTAQRWFGSTPAGIVGGLTLPLLYLELGRNSAQPESFQIPLLAGAMACWPVESDPQPLIRRTVWSGALLSAAIMFKTPVAIVALVFWLDRIVQDWKNPGWKERLRPVALFTLTLFSAPLLVLGYYTVRGAFAQVWDALVFFPIQYNRWANSRSSVVDVALSREWIDVLLPASAIALILVGLVRGILFRRKDTVRWVGMFAGAWVSMVVQATRHIYLDMVLLPALALGLGLALLQPDAPIPQEETVTWKARAFRIATAVLLVLAAAQFARGLAPLRNRYGAVARMAELEREDGGSDAVVRYVQARIGPDERIFVWGNEPLTYFLCGRPMAGPYSHLLPIVPPWPDTSKLYSWLDLMGREKPRLVLVHPCEGGWWGGDIGPKKMLGMFPEVRQWLSDEFIRIDTVQGYEIWERKP